MLSVVLTAPVSEAATGTGRRDPHVTGSGAPTSNHRPALTVCVAAVMLAISGIRR